MKLGAEGIFVELAGEAFELRPSLRACMCLVRRHGFSGLIAAVQSFNVTIIMDMLKGAAIRPSLLLEEIGTLGLGPVRNHLASPLVDFVFAIAGVDPDDTQPTEPGNTPSVSPEQVFIQLFGVATGWLGWPPKEAWNATPSEIIAAKTGRTDLISDVLKAVFGTTEKRNVPDLYTADQLGKIIAQGHDPTFDRSGLHSFRNKGRVS